MIRTPTMPSGERWAVLACVGLGTALRLWGFGELGLVHFDEGIYALVGLWVLDPRGLNALSPMVIPYAPAGFPILVGLSFRAFGPSETAAIVVSVAAGIAAIPLAAHLGYQTFGRWAGATAALLAATSGPHIAFSRMAMTDAAFLDAWLIGVWLGIRWLEALTVGRAFGFGLVVGIAQLLKYNGWLLLMGVGVAGLLGRSAIDGRSGRERLRFALGLVVAAVVAAACYWPWFVFVETHGGYRGLLAHHRGYVQGLLAWPRNAVLQADQLVALSGVPDVGRSARVGLCGVLLLPIVARRLGGTTAARIARGGLGLLAIVAFLLSPLSMLWAAAAGVPSSVTAREASRRVAAVWAVGMLALTPLYHPYARLALPGLAAAWILAAGWLVGALRIPDEGAVARPGQASFWLGTIVVTVLAMVHAGLVARGRPLPGLLAPSDSLGAAAREAVRAVPTGATVAVLARPPVVFGLLGRADVRRLPDLDTLDAASRSVDWAVLDLVQARQEGDVASCLRRLAGRWTVVAEYPTPLNLPTLLDVEPQAAAGETVPLDARLLLLRRRTPSEETPQ